MDGLINVALMLVVLVVLQDSRLLEGELLVFEAWEIETLEDVT